MYFFEALLEEKFEDTKGVIRRYQSCNQNPSIKGQTTQWPWRNQSEN